MVVEKNKLSILIPCFNEEKTIIEVLKNIEKVQLIGDAEKEVIIIDDASTDNTAAYLHSYATQSQIPLLIHTHSTNQGKGACIALATSFAKGNIVVIQDADLEYSPNDYNLLLDPILNGNADVVYGSRFIGNGPHRVLYFSHALGNRLLTFISNIFTQINLTDMETGYKMFKTNVFRKINIAEKRFGFEPEITAKISRIPEIRIYEVGISYHGRTYKEGKKISWRDGVHALWCILKYNIFNRKI